MRSLTEPRTRRVRALVSHDAPAVPAAPLNAKLKPQPRAVPGRQKRVAARLLTLTLLLILMLSGLAQTLRAQPQTVLLISDDPGPWRDIFSSVGLPFGEVSDLPPTALAARVEAGALVVLQGFSPFSEQFGIRPASAQRVPTRQIRDERVPKLPIIWEKTLDLPEVTLPDKARVFAREHWTGQPVMAGIRRGKGAVLWLAAPPGSGGYARFPFVLQALADLGLQVPARSNRLWAFLDSSYRTRADIPYLADRWQAAGISALHVAAWHYNEPDAARDAWLAAVMRECHQRGILVYAWLELPHVSERFWQDHPEWREKTALLQDAHLDWRKLMNLRNRDCFRAAEAATRALIQRFDWDGVNFGELYYESLEGAANAARFTPMNDDIRGEYRDLTGIDPLDFFRKPPEAAALTAFLQYRAESVRRMQGEWMRVAASMREAKPWLDVVLTHVDDRFDTTMREKIGADASRVLPLLKEIDFTFLVEDPATVWNLGPARYREIAKRYEPITPRPERLAIDINIVERYQDVYPTKQQTGTELLRLVHTAAQSFPRVALYFESSLTRPDLGLLPAAASGISRLEWRGESLVVDSPHGAGVQFPSLNAIVDGREWPIRSTTSGVVWLPPGAHVISEGKGNQPKLTVESLNAGVLRSAAVATDGSVQFAYSSTSRAFALLSEAPAKLEVDGEAVAPVYSAEKTLILPRGQHIIRLYPR